MSWSYIIGIERNVYTMKQNIKKHTKTIIVLSIIFLIIVSSIIFFTIPKSFNTYTSNSESIWIVYSVPFGATLEFNFTPQDTEFQEIIETVNRYSYNNSFGTLTMANGITGGYDSIQLYFFDDLNSNENDNNSIVIMSDILVNGIAHRMGKSAELLDELKSILDVE
jgi:hypothetical protein